MPDSVESAAAAAAAAAASIRAGLCGAGSHCAAGSGTRPPLSEASGATMLMNVLPNEP